MRSHLSSSHIARVIACAGVLALAVAAVALTADTENPDTYEWSAELVAFDQAAKTATVQASIVGHAEVKDFSKFAQGDQVLLTWSGYSFASGVRNLSHETAVEEGDRFAMPVEFVSFEMDNRYVRFKVPVPAEDLAKFEYLDPGQWITVTTPHEPAGMAEAIQSIRPYNS